MKSFMIIQRLFYFVGLLVVSKDDRLLSFQNAIDAVDKKELEAIYFLLSNSNLVNANRTVYDDDMHLFGVS